MILVWLVGWLFGWLVGWLFGWLVGWLVGCLVGWLVGWLVVFPTSNPPNQPAKNEFLQLLLPREFQKGREITSLVVTCFLMTVSFSQASPQKIFVNASSPNHSPENRTKITCQVNSCQCYLNVFCLYGCTSKRKNVANVEIYMTSFNQFFQHHQNHVFNTRLLQV